MVDRSSYRCAVPVAAAAALISCAPKQKIALDCVPEEVVIYVDGEPLDEPPPALDLRSDRPHKLYFKGPGLVPELVVLNSGKMDGKAKLSPSEVCVKPRYVQVGRELEMEIDPNVSTAPPSPSSTSAPSSSPAPAPHSTRHSRNSRQPRHTGPAFPAQAQR